MAQKLKQLFLKLWKTNAIIATILFDFNYFHVRVSVYTPFHREICRQRMFYSVRNLNERSERRGRDWIIKEDVKSRE